MLADGVCSLEVGEEGLTSGLWGIRGVCIRGVSWALQMLKGEDQQGPRRIFHSLKHSLMWT